MPKRGQAAMEFLMTYGWAILAVIISIVALAYFGVLNPSIFLPESCTLFPGLACTDVIVGKNTAVLTIRNGIGSNINDFRISVVGLTNCYSRYTTLSDGETKNLAVNGSGCNFQGKSLRTDLNIDYTVSTLKHTRTGKIAASIGKGNMIAYWSLDDPTARDYSGFANDGIFLGGSLNPTFTSTGCSLAGCFNFAGLGQRIEAGGTNIRFGSSSFSGVARVKSTDIDSAQSRIMGKDLTPVGSYIWLNFGNGVPYVEARDSNIISWSTPQVGASIADNAWHTVEFVIDREKGQSRVYVDGTIRGTSNIVSTGIFGDSTSVNNWKIGAQTSADTLSLTGNIDEVMLFNYAIK